MHLIKVLANLCLCIVAACHRDASSTRVSSAPTNSGIRFALLQHSYWGGGIERPLFLVFSDGTILFPSARSDGVPTQYSVIHATQNGVDSVLSAIGVDEQVRGLDSLYDFAPLTSDQHSFYLVLQEESRLRSVQVRSSFRDSVRLRAEVPAAFARVYSKVLNFAAPGARPWAPDSIEVSIWPYEYAPDNPPVPWPPKWPELADPRWRRRSDEFVGEIRTIRLPFVEAASLDSLLHSRRERQAVGIGGKKWAVDYRWVFPHDSSWMFVRKRLES